MKTKSEMNRKKENSLSNELGKTTKKDMKKIIAVLLTILFASNFTQKTIAQSNDSIKKGNGGKVALSSIGKVTLVIKEEGVSKNCEIKKFKSNYIVYEKGGTLHDLAIENIERIEMTSQNSIVFNKTGEPVIIRPFDQYNELNRIESDSNTIGGLTSAPHEISDSVSCLDTTNRYQYLTENTYYEQGLTDSKKYYKAINSFIGGVISGVFVFPVTPVMAGIIAATPASINKSIHNNPNSYLADNIEYKKGFKRGANDKKANNAIGGFLAGIATDLLLLIIFTL